MNLWGRGEVGGGPLVAPVRIMYVCMFAGWEEIVPTHL